MCVAKCQINLVQVTTLCPELPVMNYTLILEDSEGNRMESSSVTVNNKIVTIEILLMENSLYSYYIRATNGLGSNTSTAVDISKYNQCVVVVHTTLIKTSSMQAIINTLEPEHSRTH